MPEPPIPAEEAIRLKSLRERLGLEISKARRHELQLGLLLVGLDHFKQVNDTLGQHKDDALWQRSARA